MIFFGIVTKDYNGALYNELIHKKPPLEVFDVNIFGIDISYIHFLLFFVITLGLGIYLFIYKNDNSIKKTDFIAKIKLKLAEVENKNLSNKKFDNKGIKQNNLIIKIIELLTLFALFFSFYMAISGRNYLFFIQLSYFYLLIINPKSLKELTLKSIFYPLIFLLIFALTSNHPYYNLIQKISSNFLFYLICSLLTFFALRHKFQTNSKFSFKHPLFWITLLFTISEISRYFIDKHGAEKISTLLN